MAVRRSSTVKQFLLRVHPDHFRTIPKVHDENLHSIQLLNQFMDEQRNYNSGWGSERKRVFFSAYVPTTKTVEDDHQVELKRFRLDLTTNIEDNMKRILRECGVEMPHAPISGDSSIPTGASSAQSHTMWDFDIRDRQSNTTGGMDFGFNEHFAQYQHTRNRKHNRIRTLGELFTYMDDPVTQLKQQQLNHAWQSIESVKSTLVREFGLAEVATSCGWASLPLNATLMSFLKTLRKMQSSHARDIFLRGVRVDMSADASEIDYFNEYTVVLNVADVPLQWVQVLETVDSDMLQYIYSARETLEQLQRHAEHALGGSVAIVRGRTCSAIAYRGFLQDMAATASAFMDDPYRTMDSRTNKIMETITVVVEDAARECGILDDGRVQAPSCTAAAVVLEFVDANRTRIRDQVSVFAEQRSQFTLLAHQCMELLGLRSLTYAEGLRLEQVNRACTRLLAFATDTNTGASTRNASTGDMLRASQGQSVRIDRFFGLAQDGVFLVSVEL